MGKGTLVGFLFYSNKCFAMTKSLRVAAKAAETSAARVCAAAAEASQPHPADTDVSAGSQHQPATSVAGSRGASPREDVDPELAVDYSGESDELSDSKPPASLPGSPGVIPRLRIRRGEVVHLVNERTMKSSGRLMNQTTRLGTERMMSVLLLTSIRVVSVLLLTPTLVVSVLLLTPRRRL